MKKLLLLTITATLLGLAYAAKPEDTDAGKEIYTGKCAKCHKLRDPNKYSVAAWDKAMVKMKKKAKLSDEQFQQLDAYIQSIRTPKS